MKSSDGGTAQGDDLPKSSQDERPRSGPRASYPTRDGSPKTRRRWFIGLSVLVVAAGIAIAALGWAKFGNEDVSGTATGYEILDASTVAVQFTVSRNDPSQPVACVVRARSKDGSETGRREVLIGPSTDKQIGARTTVSASQPPVIGEVFGCSTDVPAYLTKADVQVAGQ